MKYYNNIGYIDIGNSAIKFAKKNNENFEFIKIYSIVDLDYNNILNFVKKQKFDLLVFSSVRPSLNSNFINISKELNIKILDLKELSLKPFFGFLEKKLIGSDITCLVAGASSSYTLNNIIISLGTATTISLVIKGKFIGILILPGLDISAQALFNNAELLKKFEYEFSHKEINRNTNNALNLGIVNSTQITIEYWINHIKKNYENIVFDIIFTGGNVNKLNLNSEYIKDELLLFKGLDFFCKKNKIL